MLNSAVRNTFKSFFWLAVGAGVVAGNVVLWLNNYLGLVTSFELLGYELKSLFQDQLLGQMLGAFFPKATQTHTLALAVAFFMHAGFFCSFHTLFTLLDLRESRRDARTAGDARLETLLDRHFWQAGLQLLFLLGLLVTLVWWDVSLYRYRLAAAALNIDQPAAAVSTIKNWGELVREHQHLFAWSLARPTTWGYVSLTALASLVFEIVLRLLGAAFALCFTNWQQLLAGGEGGQGVLYGYDEQGQPVYDPATPLAYDAAGGPLETAHAFAAPPGADDQRPGFASSPEGFNSPTQPPQGNGTEQPQGVPGGLFNPPAEAPEEPAEEAAAIPVVAEGATPVEVMGGAEGERVTFYEAYAQPERYVVQEATQRVWDRVFWERLHADAAGGAEEGR